MIFLLVQPFPCGTRVQNRTSNRKRVVAADFLERVYPQIAPVTETLEQIRTEAMHEGRIVADDRYCAGLQLGLERG
jgi:hypothetical protein